MGDLGASCSHTLSDQKRDIPKAEWDQERFGQLCATPDSFANWKASLIKLCKETKLCTFAEEKAIKAASKRIEKLEQRMKLTEEGE